MSKYFAPSFNESSFHCAICNVYANQSWHSIYALIKTYEYLGDIKISICSHCNKMSYWYNRKLIIPDSSTAPPPHVDLPMHIASDYLEAASILNKSPRGAAAILRLCLQQLMVELGESGRNINSDIASLVKKGLPEVIQQALDFVRVIGNEAVHPGEINLKDDHETSITLFELINYIVEEQITRKKKINSLYQLIPERIRKHIEDRDKNKEEELI